MKGKNIEAIYRLSALQEGMLFHTIEAPRSGVYFEQYGCIIDDMAHPDSFRRAWERLVDRHAVLRTLFTWERRDQPLQIVRQRVDLPWEELDWRHLAESEQCADWESLIRLDRDRGFDLQRAPLMRITLVRIGAQRWRMLWSFHHLILDGWSMRLLLNEMQQCYRVLVGGEDCDVGKAPAFAAFVSWLDRRDKAASESYWSTYLAGYDTPTLLFGPALDRSKDVDVGLPAAQRSVHVDADVTRRLHSFITDSRLTLNSLVVGGWALLLSRYCRSDDVVFGATVSGRTPELADVERIAGLFINTLPVRVRLRADERVSDWLSAVQTGQSESRTYEQTPLVDIQRCSDVPAGSSLFESILVFENFPSRDASEDRGTISISSENYIEYSNFPLAIIVVPGESLELIGVYDVTRFSESFIDRLLRHLVASLRAIAESGSRPLGQLTLASADEVRDQLDDWRKVDLEVPREGGIHSLIEARVRDVPDNAAIAFAAESLSYRQLDQAANRLACRLAAQGVEIGTRVSLLCERSTDAIVVILAILKAGAAYVPVDPAFPNERIAYVLDDVRRANLADGKKAGSIVVTQKHLLGRIPEGDFVALCMDDNMPVDADQPATAPDIPVDPQHPAYVIYTSGSTGQPKGVQVSHAALMHSTLARLAYYQQTLSSYLLLSSLATDSSIAGLFWSLVAGAKLVLPRTRQEQDMQSLRGLLVEHRVSHLLCVPSLYQLLLEESSAADRVSLKVAIVAGEACPPAVVERHRSLMPDAALYNEYGPSEACVWATVARLDDGPFESVPSIGRPIANTSLYLLDQHLQFVPAGVAGEVFIGGANLAQCYLNQSELTASRFIRNPFRSEPAPTLYRTGDLARRLADGRFQFIGRVDNQIKIRGYRVELEEIEAQLERHSAVQQAAVAMVESGGKDKTRPQLVACVVPAAGELPDLAELKTFLRDKLPDYMVPQGLSRADRLPRTVTGKLDRVALRDQLSVKGTASVAGSVSPRSEAEAVLQSVWCEVLGIEDIGVNENFFELGGDSLLSIRVLSRARQRGLAINPEDFFSRPTIAGQAACANDDVTDRSNASLLVGEVGLTPIQHWFFENITADRHHWNQSMLLRLAGAIGEHQLQRAVHQLVLHHDALRARFQESGGEWVSTVDEPQALPPFSTVDLSAGESSEIAEQIAAIAAEVHAGFRLGEGGLFRVVMIRTPGAVPDRLLMVAHHLLVDAVSWQVLREDLETACEQIRRGDAPSLPDKTTSVKMWVDCARRDAAGEGRVAETDWWSAEGQAIRFDLPIDHPSAPEENRFGTSSLVSRSLTESETTALLSDLPARYQTTIMDALLAAFAASLANWSGQPDVQFDVEGHGRQPLFQGIDVSRTVGWFTSSYPFFAHVEAAEDAGSLLRQTKERVRRIPDQGVGYGILRYLSRSAGQRLAHSIGDSKVLFNYLGQVDDSTGLFELEEMNFGQARSADGNRPYLIEVNVRASRGALKMDWSFSTRFHRAESIVRLADAYGESLRRLIAYCADDERRSHAPSDFPLADLDQEELDGLSVLLGQMDGADGNS